MGDAALATRICRVRRGRGTPTSQPSTRGVGIHAGSGRAEQRGEVINQGVGNVLDIIHQQNVLKSGEPRGARVATRACVSNLDTICSR
jgi:hypothetical protein